MISLFQLPISEYPEVVPPSVVVHAQYPGANPEGDRRNSGFAARESRSTAWKTLLYMQSQANSDGNLTLTVTFKLGTNPDLATQLVQNRVPTRLCRVCRTMWQRLGVTTIKSSPTLTMVVHTDLAEQPVRHDVSAQLRKCSTVKDRLERIQGVGEVQLWGSGDYAMRVWLDPQKVAARGLTATDVVNAIREQNVQVACRSDWRLAPSLPPGHAVAAVGKCAWPFADQR